MKALIHSHDSHYAGLLTSQLERHSTAEVIDISQVDNLRDALDANENSSHFFLTRASLDELIDSLRTLKQHPALKQTLLIAAVPYVSPEQVTLLNQAGAHAVIQLPPERERLIKILASECERLPSCKEVLHSLPEVLARVATTCDRLASGLKAAEKSTRPVPKNSNALKECVLKVVRSSGSPESLDAEDFVTWLSNSN